MRLTIPVLRDLVMLGLGSAGMVHELFLATAPNPLSVGASMLLLLGSATANAWWLARRTPPNGTTESLPPASQPSSRSPSL